MKDRTIDIIIPTYKPGEEFREVLKRLKNQNYPVGHILIINTDESLWNPQLIHGIEGAEVFHIKPEEFDHAASRDMGADLSDADIIVFMTQDAVPADTHLIEKLVEPLLSDKMIRLSYARQLPKSDCRPAERLVRAFNYPQESRIQEFAEIKKLGVRAFFCSDVCAAYDRKTFEEMRGFDAPCIFNEDSIFAARLLMQGYKVSYTAGAKVLHSHNYSNRKQFRRNFDNGVSRAMHPEIYGDLPADKEGKKLLGYVVRGLERQGKAYLVPGFIIECIFRWSGFHLGLMYSHLPMNLVKMCSMNKRFWDWERQS